jgi:hypothetical protein
MRIALSFLATCIAMSLLQTSGADAESAFINQAISAYSGHQIAVPVTPMTTSGAAPSWTPGATGLRNALPEMAAASGSNYAGTLELGAYNKVFQAQLGAGNVSNVGIIKGYANKVGVLQAGNDLKSNIALINTQGLSVGVIQPNGSAPVNMLIARLPNGALLIKR